MILYLHKMSYLSFIQAATLLNQIPLSLLEGKCHKSLVPYLHKFSTITKMQYTFENTMLECCVSVVFE